MPRYSSKSAICLTCSKSFTFYACPSNLKRRCGRYCSSSCYKNRPLIPIIDRFFRYVGRKTATGCIPWTGPKTSGRGYLGRGRAGEGSIFAHRVAYEYAYGPIPNGLVVCHRCDNPACVNPSHLFLGTQADNMSDMNAKMRHAYGERTHLNTLTADQIPLIRGALASGESQSSIAKRFGVTQSNISAIACGKTWRQVKG